MVSLSLSLWALCQIVCLLVDGLVGRQSRCICSRQVNFVESSRVESLSDILLTISYRSWVNCAHTHKLTFILLPSVQPMDSNSNSNNNKRQANRAERNFVGNHSGPGEYKLESFISGSTFGLLGVKRMIILTSAPEKSRDVETSDGIEREKDEDEESWRYGKTKPVWSHIHTQFAQLTSPTDTREWSACWLLVSLSC